MTTIRNQAGLARMLCADNTKASIERQVYKCTNCGAWIELRKDGITIGSIVEGADFGTATYSLSYPFTEDDYRAREKAIEAEADAIWKWANEGPEDSDQTWADLDQDAPDVDREYLHLNPNGRSA